MTTILNKPTTRRSSFRADGDYRRINALFGWPEVVEDDTEEASIERPIGSEPEGDNPFSEQVVGLAVLEAISEHAPAIEILPENRSDAEVRP